MNYPVIDPVGTGANIKALIKRSGNTVAGTAKALGLAEKSTIYKWMRGDAMPSIDSLLALSMMLGVTINDILAVA
jgi:transcriptional regulator with XRE-family HTH domain